MTRECEVCKADLDKLGKRSSAKVCGGACRAEKSRRKRAGVPVRSAEPAEAHRKRTRRPRRGVSIYLPDPETAQKLADDLAGFSPDSIRGAFRLLLLDAIDRRQARQK